MKLLNKYCYYLIRNNFKLCPTIEEGRFLKDRYVAVALRRHNKRYEK